MPWEVDLEFEPHGATTEAEVSAVESQLGVRLPDVYRNFLLVTGGGYLRDGLAVCDEPTPFGKMNIVELYPIDGIERLLDSAITPRNMICIGGGHFGMTTCLSLVGLDHGRIFALDTEMRVYWNENDLIARPHLHESIKEFFRLRDREELPEKPWGYDNCYRVAESFGDFLGKLHRSKRTD